MSRPGAPGQTGPGASGPDALAAATSDRLAAAGIPSILLIEPATLLPLHPDDGDRLCSSAVDLLVSAAQFDAAEQVLEVLGYRDLSAGLRVDEKSWNHRVWRSPARKDLVVDLQRGCAGVSKPDRFFSALWSSRSQLALGGSTVAIPGAAGAALILALRAAADGTTGRPNGDTTCQSMVFGQDEWRTAAALARRSGAEPAFRAGLARLPQGQRLTDMRLGGAVAVREWFAAAPYAVREAPAIVVLGTLSELTLGDDVGASDGFDGFGAS